MNIDFVDEDQNWQEQTTTYWFNVDGESWGICDDGDFKSLLNCDGCPVNESDAKNVPIYHALISEVEKLNAE